MTKKADVIVVGGGIIGTAIGYYLTQKGKKVTVVEKEDLASGATGSCDQFIIMQSKIPGIHLEIAMESSRLYHQLAADFEEDIEHHETGGLIVIENEKELKVMEERVQKQTAGGLKVEILDIKEAQKIQPQLGDHLVGAVYCPIDGHVSPLKTTQAFSKYIEQHGGKLMMHTAVTGIKVENDVVKGVYTDQGEIEGEIVVNAAGYYAPQIGEMVGLEIPIKPKRGQLVVTEPVPEFIPRVALSTKYLAAKHNPEILENVNPRMKELGVGLAMEQTQKGNLLFGSTREFAGYDRRVTREGILEVIKNATNIYPRLRELHVIRSFAGLRPATPDGLPVLGHVGGPEGFIMAAGHEGDGICLAPVTGKMMADYICGEDPGCDFELFSLNRFDPVK